MNKIPQLVETNSDICSLPSTCLQLYRANHRMLFPYAFTEYPESTLLHLAYQEYFPDNPDSPESEQRSVPISSDSRGSTVLFLNWKSKPHINSPVFVEEWIRISAIFPKVC
ncbi:hypothetical protein AVEN_51572-1 [Araneus ventricosus]|uniref:Uncharacterized protein n=1 Tax=Araneus ventricosus TaxID=182803 RepID=A0A4Y2SMZ0_ARAVE|nr:hypothetical protein AVEN_51572-1 [Araneus ventricosus]